MLERVSVWFVTSFNFSRLQVGGGLRTHRAGGFEGELGERLRGELEVCWQLCFLNAGTEGRLAVGGGSLWRQSGQQRLQLA